MKKMQYVVTPIIGGVQTNALLSHFCYTNQTFFASSKGYHVGIES